MPHSTGEPVALTAIERALIELLLRRSPAVVTRRTIAVQVWDDEADAVGSNTIDVHVGRLRAKLGETAARIETVRGTGLPDGDRVNRDRLMRRRHAQWVHAAQWPWGRRPSWGVALLLALAANLRHRRPSRPGGRPTWPRGSPHTPGRPRSTAAVSRGATSGAAISTTPRCSSGTVGSDGPAQVLTPGAPALPAHHWSRRLP